MRAAVFIASIALSLIGDSCWAAAIVNLSSEPQTIQFSQWQGGASVTISPKQAWRVPGRVAVWYGGREVHIDEEEEFAIWKTGELGPQRRMMRRSHSGF